MANKRRFVPIENKQYGQLEGFSDLTGRPVQDLVQEAIANYIYCDIEPYVEVLAQRSESA
jgi:hypothetical protein